MASWKACPRCGEPWQPWPGSKLTSHARCHFSPEEQDAILGRFEKGGVTQAQLAADLDVSIGVLRATLNAAHER